MRISAFSCLTALLSLFIRFVCTSPISGRSVHNREPHESYPDPSPCYGNISWVHDPSIIYEDGTYWRFSTSGNIAVATAPSMKGPWTYKGPLLPSGTKIYVADNQDIWAPSASKINDQYFIHYSVSTMGSQASQIGLATAPSLSGPWIDHGALNIPQQPTYNLIDPSVFQDLSDETLYFTFGSYWSGIQQFALSSHEQLLALAGTAIHVERIQAVVTNTTAAPAVVEGGIMFKHTDSYFLFFSVGLCCNTPAGGLAAPGDEYRIAVCRAECAMGPFVDRDGRDCKDGGGTTVLASHGDVYAPGGQGVLRLEDGNDVIYYHYVRPSVGYEANQFFFGWNHLEWGEGWPVVV